MSNKTDLLKSMRPSLGSKIRAARMGFRWSKKIDRFLRMTPLDSHRDNVQFEICSEDRIFLATNGRNVKTRGSRKPLPTDMHIEWWRDREMKEVVEEFVLNNHAPHQEFCSIKMNTYSGRITSTSC